MNEHLSETLEQRRARNAWSCCATCNEDYKRVAKGMPAMIMNSGLMQVLAFMQSKKEAQQLVSEHLRTWLSSRYPKLLHNGRYVEFMEQLMRLNSTDYQAVTVEALSWLKWLRQLAGTVEKG